MTFLFAYYLFPHISMALCRKEHKSTHHWRIYSIWSKKALFMLEIHGNNRPGVGFIHPLPSLYIIAYITSIFIYLSLSIHFMVVYMGMLFPELAFRAAFSASL